MPAKEGVSMSAYVEYEFERGFILDEERIRRINEIIRTRLPTEDEHLVLNYAVYRSDSYVYMTQNVEDVIREDNGESQRIVRILASVQDARELPRFVAGFQSIRGLSEQLETSGLRTRLSLNLDFDTNKRSGLYIQGEDRDLVYLLYSDLRQYLIHEVNVCRYLSGFALRVTATSVLFLSAVTSIVAYFVNLVASQIQSPEIVKSVLESQSVIDKLNYLISKNLEVYDILTGRALLPVLLLLFAGMLLALAAAAAPSRFWYRFSTFIFPRNIFLLGKEIKRHADTQRRRSNLLWVVIVGFLLLF